MKIGLIATAVLGLAMAGQTEEKKGMECKPLYEGTMNLLYPYGGDTRGMKFSKHVVKPYGGKLLEVKSSEKSNVEVVVSECMRTGIKKGDQDFKQGTISVKGEKGKCLLHAAQKSEEGANVLYAGDCKRSTAVSYTHLRAHET